MYGSAGSVPRYRPDNILFPLESIRARIDQGHQEIFWVAFIVEKRTERRLKDFFECFDGIYML